MDMKVNSISPKYIGLEGKKKNSGGFGTVDFISKDKADELASMGFKYKENKINANQVVYSFIDTPELRKAIAGKFASNEFFVNKTLYL